MERNEQAQALAEAAVAACSNSKVTVTFLVKPDNTYPDPVIWKCTVNPSNTLFESNTGNNDASAMFMITEKEETPFPWLILVIALIIIGLIIFALIYFLVIRTQKGQMAKCSNCGGLVEVEATVCQHCGIEFSEEIECECGTLIPSGAKECPSCHKPVLSPVQSIEEGEEEATPDTEVLEKAPEEEEAAEEGAPKTEVEKPKDDTSGKEEPAESEMAECFECGAVIPISAPICPHCGAVFE